MLYGGAAPLRFVLSLGAVVASEAPLLRSRRRRGGSCGAACSLLSAKRYLMVVQVVSVGARGAKAPPGPLAASTRRLTLGVEAYEA